MGNRTGKDNIINSNNNNSNSRTFKVKKDLGLDKNKRVGLSIQIKATIKEEGIH